MYHNEFKTQRQLRINRGHKDLTAASVTPPDELRVGRYYMILGSDVINVYMTPLGPSADFQQSGEAASTEPFLMLAYCFPFASIVIVHPGENKSKRHIIDVRQHRLAEVSRRFVASLFSPGSEARKKIFKADHGEGAEHRTSIENIKDMGQRFRSLTSE